MYLFIYCHVLLQIYSGHSHFHFVTEGLFPSVAKNYSNLLLWYKWKCFYSFCCPKRTGSCHSCCFSYFIYNLSAGMYFNMSFEFVNIHDSLLIFFTFLFCFMLQIGHVTKSGDIAGPRVLEHIVDVVLYLEVSTLLIYLSLGI